MQKMVKKKILATPDIGDMIGEKPICPFERSTTS